MRHSAAYPTLLHPLHALLLAFPVALFTGALVTDITYLNSAHMQWSNFSAWLNAGALFVGGFLLLWAIILVFRTPPDARRRPLLYLLLLAAMWIIGLVNAFQHSRDGWSSVGTAGVIMSLLSALLAITAAWVAHSRTPALGARA